MKKILSIIILACVSIVMCFTLTGCRLWAKSLKLPWYESGDYKYAVNTLKDGTKEAYLIGLTEQGSKQKYLVLPSEIDGIAVTQMGYYQSTGFTSYPVPGGSLNESECNAEKFYVSDSCLNIIENTIEPIFEKYPKRTVFMFFSSNLTNNSMAWWAFNDSIIPYINIQKEQWKELSNHFSSEIVKTWKLNNVSYMYNYNDAPDKGYYWIDSWDNTLIDFIPPEPTRAGYAFDGWYKNKECTDIWDFYVDKTGNLIKYDKSGEIDTSSEIFLYAKWLKI